MEERRTIVPGKNKHKKHRMVVHWLEVPIWCHTEFGEKEQIETRSRCDFNEKLDHRNQRDLSSRVQGQVSATACIRLTQVGWFSCRPEGLGLGFRAQIKSGLQVRTCRNALTVILKV